MMRCRRRRLKPKAAAAPKTGRGPGTETGLLTGWTEEMEIPNPEVGVIISFVGRKEPLTMSLVARE